VPVLTDRSVQQMKPKVSRIEVADAVLPGLYLVVQPSGVKSWAARFRLRGRSRQLTIGRFPAVGLKAARDATRKALESVSLGADPSVVKRQGTPADGSVGAAVALYKERRVSQLRPGTQYNIGLECDRMVRAWGARPLKAITKADVIALVDTRPAGSAAANTTAKYIKAFFRWCEGHGDIETNPALTVRKPSEQKSRTRWLNDLELATVWHAADKASKSERPGNAAQGAMVKLIILTGARRDEIASLVSMEIHGDEMVIPAERVKNNRELRIPITTTMRAIIDNRPKTGAFVLNGRHPVADGTHTQRAIKCQTIADWRVHDLRRSFATGLARLGVSIAVIERCLNHRSGVFRGIVDVYQQHDFAAEVRAAYELWDAHIVKITS
jgi:integrase